MSKTLADADLDAGLDEAKKKPRYFAIITKGQTIVKMIVQKKRIKDNDIQLARREFGGNAEIIGVCVRNGSEVLLQVLEKEPTLKTIKVKEFITEQTGATVKPQWQVVAALSAVLDDEDDVPLATKQDAAPLERARQYNVTETRAKNEASASQSTTPYTPVAPTAYSSASTTPPPSNENVSVSTTTSQSTTPYTPASTINESTTPYTPASTTNQATTPYSPSAQTPLNAATSTAPPPVQAAAAPQTKKEKVRAALEKARPKIVLAIKAFEKPASAETPISDRLERIEKLLDDTQKDQSDLAMSLFRELVAFIAPLMENRGAVPKDENQAQRMVQLQQSRNLWEMARKKLHARLQGVAAAVMEECSNPEEYDLGNVKEGVKKLDDLMEHLNDQLIVVLDQALNANDLAARDTLEQQAGELVRDYMLIVQNHPLVEALDSNGLVNCSIRDSMSKVLKELDRRLAT